MHRDFDGVFDVCSLPVSQWRTLGHRDNCGSLQAGGDGCQSQQRVEDVHEHLRQLVCAVPQYPAWDVVRGCSFLGVDPLKGLPNICCSHTEGRVTGWWCESDGGSVAPVECVWQRGVSWALCSFDAVVCDSLNALPHAPGVI